MAPLRNILPLHKRDAPAASGEPKNGNHPHTNHSKSRTNPMSAYVTNRWRNEIVAALAEFAGTFMFLCKWCILLFPFAVISKQHRDPLLMFYGYSLCIRRHTSRKHSSDIQRSRYIRTGE